MMTQQDKERHDTLVNTIGESLKILNKDYGTSFILTLLTKTDDEGNVIVHSGCNCTFREAVVMFEDLSEDDRNIAKAMGMVAVLTDRKKNN